MTLASPGRLHVITDETLQERFSHVDLARLAVAGGADVVQYREKRERTTAELVRTARAIRQAIGSHRTMIVNDRPDVALAAEADGVHLGRHDVEPRRARLTIGQLLVGRTANSLEEALIVSREPVDYLGVGPVHGTTSKDDPAPPLGLELLKRIVEAVDKPVIAIGGITAERVAGVLKTGAHGVAVLSEVACSEDPARRVSDLLEALQACIGVERA